MGNPAYPGAGGAPNTHVQTFDLQRSIITGFIRNEQDFAVNKYVQIVTVEKSTDLYLVLDRHNCARIYDDGNEWLWPDGSDAPTGVTNNDDFDFKSFRCKRYAPSFKFGLLAEQEANWPIAQQHSLGRAMQAMVLRTDKAKQLLTNAANYVDGNTDTATNVAGGLLKDATSTNMYIKKALLAMYNKINLNTIGKVQPEDCMVVMGLSAAQMIGETDEIQNYVKGASVDAWRVLQKNLGNNGGLPDSIYDFKIVVDRTPYVTSKKNKTNTATIQEIWPSDQLVMIARPGGIEGVYGGPSFASVTMFARKQLVVQTNVDVWNETFRGRVVDMYDMVMTSSASSYLLTGIQ